MDRGTFYTQRDKMAKKWTLRSRRFEISFEKTETFCVAKRRETVVAMPREPGATAAESEDSGRDLLQIEPAGPATSGGEDDQF
jgi:hypothetical protein